MTAETFLDVLIALMIIGCILGARHSRRLRKWWRSHNHHHIAH